MFLSSFHKILSKKKRLTNALTAIFFVLVGCETKSKIVNLCLSSKPRTLEPLKYQEVAILQVLCNIYEPLVEDDEKFTVKPVLATYWEKMDSLTWIFYIRKGVKFHNGKQLDSKDVIYSIYYPRSLDYSEFRTHEIIIDTAIASSDSTIIIKTKKPNDFLINELKGFYIIPYGFKVGDPPCGTGPYKIDRILDTVIVLKRFEKYWGKKPFFKFAYITFSDDPKKRLDKLIRGLVDLIDYVPLEFTDTVIKYGKLLYTPEFSLRELEFNVTIYPFNIPEFRKAICYAINRESIVKEYYKGLASPANQFFPYGTMEHDVSLSQIPHDTGYARYVFKKYRGTRPIILDYSLIVKPLGDLIVKQLRELGLNIVGNPMPSVKFWEKVKSKKSQMFLIALVFSDKYGYSALASSFHSYVPNSYFGVSNRTGYSNSIVDSLIEIMMYTEDTRLRNELVSLIQKIVLEDMPICPIAFERQYYGVRKDINWIPRLNRRIYIKDMSRK
ncbi:MAG: ABC transporter substrate-binding protein [candidate division WOR-3 bacterium]